MRLATLCIALAGGFAVWAQPVITPKGIANSAGFQPAGVPGGAIARGSTFTLFGAGLGPSTPAQQPSYPLQATLAGVSVKISQGATNVDAFPTYVSDGALNVIMPSNAPLGLVSVHVTFNGQTSNPQTVRVVNNNPSLFTSTGLGLGPGAIYNLLDSGFNQNSPLRAAKPGQLVALFANGLGPIAQRDADSPPVGNLPFPVEIFVGNVAVTNILYSGRLPGVAGIDQINFQVPSNAPSGCYVPLVVRVAGTQVSNTATLAIDAKGGACSDPFNPLSSALLNGGTFGIVALQRQTLTQDVLMTSPTTVTTDEGQAYFGSFTGSEYTFHPLIGLPPPGSCTTYVGSGNLPRSPSTDLAAGAIAVSGPNGTQNFSSVTEDAREDFALLGLNPAVPGIAAIPLYLGAGAYKITAAGSNDVGPFTSNLTVSAPLTWTNRTQARTVDRSQPLTLNWTGGGAVFIRGTNQDFPTNSLGTFLCNVPSGATSFTVPDYVLAALPGTRAALSTSEGYLELHSFGQGSPQVITANKLANGAALVDFVDRRSAIYK